jgi:hypothetical protein
MASMGKRGAGNNSPASDRGMGRCQRISWRRMHRAPLMYGGAISSMSLRLAFALSPGPSRCCLQRLVFKRLGSGVTFMGFQRVSGNGASNLATTTRLPGWGVGAIVLVILLAHKAHLPCIRVICCVLALMSAQHAYCALYCCVLVHLLIIHHTTVLYIADSVWVSSLEGY